MPFLDADGQRALLNQVRAVLAEAPAYRPRMPRTGQPLSVRMTNAGPLGWVPTKAGYGYQAHHPETGRPWPTIPALALEAWHAFGDDPHPPDACLINLYDPGSRMGLHQDFDEEDLGAPVVSLSLGDEAVYRLGNAERRGAPTRSFRLRSGDAFTLKGAARLAYHGVDRIVPGTAPTAFDLADILPDGGRINLTLRRARRVG
ncbi:MAG: alpha-ketoglutarate-dependent dioxygenase AlkB [Pseudomonadota bacterium]